jgi:hypothetical protein
MCGTIAEICPTSDRENRSRNSRWNASLSSSSGVKRSLSVMTSWRPTRRARARTSRELLICQPSREKRLADLLQPARDRVQRRAFRPMVEHLRA